MRARVMKSLAAPSICLAVTGTVLVGGLGLASYGFREQEPHHFANLDAPLWTTIPTRVDPKTQNYERLPPLQAAADALSSTPAKLVGVTAIAPPDATVTGAIEQPTPEWMADGRHLSLCQQRYRSYNVADNTYQPFDGGPRKPCVIEDRELSVGLPAADTSPNPHISWCAARYISYRALDNTYQPFTGPRRQCVSPII
ncbi:hypothetical protein GCM10010520_32420 [Rhizobium viscosum]|uniref:Lectin-like protein BA14k n=1 Tax=Rhizobium viscosum TaxID=1673 RepID=A0ABR9IV84_RHIVS|nr:BA14K family protein [Rhizobium viscosum]MBE1507104.1 hypothetical protein [Rhizobium viscosum]